MKIYSCALRKKTCYLWSNTLLTGFLIFSNFLSAFFKFWKSSGSKYNLPSKKTHLAPNIKRLAMKPNCLAVNNNCLALKPNRLPPNKNSLAFFLSAILWNLGFGPKPHTHTQSHTRTRLLPGVASEKLRPFCPRYLKFSQTRFSRFTTGCNTNRYLWVKFSVPTEELLR